MPKIKIGQIGVGHAHAAGKMDVYRKSPEYEVVGVVEPDEKLKRQAEANPGTPGAIPAGAPVAAKGP